MLSPRPALVGFALLAALAALSVLLSTRDGRPRSHPRISATPATTAEETAYQRALEPRLRDAVAEARALVAIGDRRSRNLLEIRAAQGRMADALQRVDDLTAARPAPPRFAPALDSYRLGSESIRTAMDDAQAGFLRFDWDRVAAAYDRLADGARRLERAIDQLPRPAPAATAEARAARSATPEVPPPALQVAPDVL